MGFGSTLQVSGVISEVSEDGAVIGGESYLESPLYQQQIILKNTNVKKLKAGLESTFLLNKFNMIAAINMNEVSEQVESSLGFISKYAKFPGVSEIVKCTLYNTDGNAWFKRTLCVAEAPPVEPLDTLSHVPKYGRPVTAVPSSIYSPAARGTIGLLRTGRARYCTADDVLDTLHIAAAPSWFTGEVTIPVQMEISTWKIINSHRPARHFGTKKKEHAEHYQALKRNDIK